MHDLSSLTTFFGWCSIINIGLLAFTSLLLLGMKNLILGIHGKVTGIPDSELNVLYFQYLGHYKIAIIVLNIVPYLALKLMA
jgi:hypothetical protein